MAKTREEIRKKWNKLKDHYEEAEAKSIALEEKYERLVAKIRRSKPKNVPEEAFVKLESLWEKIRKSHIAERNAKHDAELYQVKALAQGAISKEEIKEGDIFNTRGVRSQAKLGIDRGAFNPSFDELKDSIKPTGNAAKDAEKAEKHSYLRTLLEYEFAAWADIHPLEARELFIQAAQPSDSHLSFQERCVELFQTHGKKWKKNRAFIDLETTALDPYLGEIIEIGIKVVDPEGNTVLEIDERFDLERADVRDILGVGATHIHHIAPEDVAGKRKFSDPDVQKMLGDVLNDPNVVIVPHHAAFEHSHLSQHLDGYHAAHVKESAESLRRREKTFQNGVPSVLTQDTRVICTYLMLSSKNTLEEFAISNGIAQEEYTETAHGAFPDADMTFRALWRFRKRMQEAERGVRLKSLNYKEPTSRYRK